MLSSTRSSRSSGRDQGVGAPSPLSSPSGARAPRLLAPSRPTSGVFVCLRYAARPMSLWNSAHPWLRDLVSYEPGKPIEDVARDLGLKPHEIIKLASNENPLGPSPKALAAMREMLERAHFYPDGGGYYLREAIAQKMGLERSNVILGCGSNEIIEFIGKAFLSPGDDIIAARHAFVVYKLMA